MGKDTKLYLCSLCGGMTPLVMKKDYLYGGIQHNYAECRVCKGKTTHSYTDNHIRVLLAKQERTSPGSKKEKLAQRIIKEMNQLKARYEKEILSADQKS